MAHTLLQNCTGTCTNFGNPTQYRYSIEHGTALSIFIYSYVFLVCNQSKISCLSISTTGEQTNLLSFELLKETLFLKEKYKFK